MKNYYYDRKINLPFEEIEPKLTEVLKEKGFGILTKIDVKQTMREKLGEEYDNYVIFGACNPTFANQALKSDKQIGLLLPCNIIAYTDENGENHVSVIKPTVALEIANTNMNEMAQEVEDILILTINSL